MTLILDLDKGRVILQEPSPQDLEMEMVRFDFEQEWQEAMTREEITNAILCNVKGNYDKGIYVMFYPYDIQNQARNFGDLEYVKGWKESFKVQEEQMMKMNLLRKPNDN